MTDQTSYGNDGTINGATWMVSSSLTYTYSPTANYNGSDSFTFTASDGNLLDTATVSITVNAVDDPPVVSDSTTVMINEDTDYSGILPAASDVDGDTLTYSNYFEIDQSQTSAITNEAGGDFNPGQSFTVEKEGYLERIDLAIWPAGSPYLKIRYWSSNVDSSAMGGTEVTRSEVATNMPSTDNYGDYSTFIFPDPIYLGQGGLWVFELIDGTGYITTDADYTAGQAYGSLNTSMDRDMRFITYMNTGESPTHGVLTITDSLTGAYTYEPFYNFNGTDAFTYSVSDGVYTDSVTVTITVSAVNDNPLILNSIYETDFESFNVGDTISHESQWALWDSTALNQSIVVSTAQALSGTQSLEIDDGDDVVLLLGDRTSGKYAARFNYYVPSGGEAYFNFQHFEEVGIEWAMSVYFNSDGSAGIRAGRDWTSFSYAQDTWTNILMVIDMDLSLIHI